MKTANAQGSKLIVTAIAAGEDRAKWMASQYRPDPSIKSWRIVMDFSESGDLLEYWESSLDRAGNELIGGGISHE